MTRPAVCTLVSSALAWAASVQKSTSNKRTSSARLRLVIKGAASGISGYRYVRLNATPVIRVSWNRICQSNFPPDLKILSKDPLNYTPRQFRCNAKPGEFVWTPAFGSSLQSLTSKRDPASYLQ